MGAGNDISKVKKTNVFITYKFQFPLVYENQEYNIKHIMLESVFKHPNEALIRRLFLQILFVNSKMLILQNMVTPTKSTRRAMCTALEQY